MIRGGIGAVVGEHVFTLRRYSNCTHEDAGHGREPRLGGGGGAVDGGHSYE